MRATRPNLHFPLVNANGTLQKPLIDLLAALQELLTTTTDTATADGLTALIARVQALETGLGNLYGTNGIDVLGSLESGLQIRGSADSGPLAAQIFGG